MTIARHWGLSLCFLLAFLLAGFFPLAGDEAARGPILIADGLPGPLPPWDQGFGWGEPPRPPPIVPPVAPPPPAQAGGAPPQPQPEPAELAEPPYRAGREVALVPFWGGDAVVVASFGEELYDAVDNAEGFLPVRVGEPAAAPPFALPSSSITQGAPYSITGDLFLNPDSGQWHLQLYLWHMVESRLVISDEVVALTREDANAAMPQMTEWLLSWIPESPPPPGGGRFPATMANVQGPAAGSPSSGFNRLYAGLYAGWSFNMLSYQGDQEGIRDTNWQSAHLGAFANFRFADIRISDSLRFQPGVQAEAVVSHYLGEGVWALTVPAMLALTLRAGDTSISALGGAYAFLPLRSPEGVEFDGIMGVTAGARIGRRIAGGFGLFADLRWSGDMFDITVDGNAFRRNALSASIGIERGFFGR